MPEALTFTLVGNRLAMSERDITKEYKKEEFVEKLRRLAESIESGENFRISIAGRPFMCRTGPASPLSTSAAMASTKSSSRSRGKTSEHGQGLFSDGRVVLCRDR